MGRIIVFPSITRPVAQLEGIMCVVAQLLCQHRCNFKSTTCVCLGLRQGADEVKAVVFGLALTFGLFGLVKFYVERSVDKY